MVLSVGLQKILKAKKMCHRSRRLFLQQQNLLRLEFFFSSLPQDVHVYNEEVELDGRDPEQDYLQYKESCESLATLMSEIQELKANGAKEGVRITSSRYTSKHLQPYGMIRFSVIMYQ